MEILWYIVKALTGVTIAIAGAWFETKNRKMRIFDSFTSDVKIDILETAIAYAKAEINEQGLQVDLVEYACGYGEMFFLQETDFTLIDTQVVTAWVGGRPVRRPKTW